MTSDTRIPALTQLSDDEVRSVLGYLKTLWGPSERAFQARVTEQERR